MPGFTPQSSVGIEYTGHSDALVNFDIVTKLEGEEVERRAVEAPRDQTSSPNGYITIAIADLDVAISTGLRGYDSVEAYIQLS